MTAAIITAAIEASPLNRGLIAADWLADPRNIAFVDGEDVTLFDYEGGGDYQVHVLYRSRGRAAVACLKNAFARMFLSGRCEMIFGLVPDFRRDVKMVSRLAGGKSVRMVETDEGPCELFVLSRDIWKRSLS